jgi:methyltransferase-like protein
VTRLHVASAARPVSPAPDLASGAEEKFTGLAGVHIKSTEPLIKAAMLTLAEQWPASVSFDELCRIARQRIGAGGTPEGDARLLSGRLWQFYSTAGGCAVELSCLPYPGPPRPSGKPAARKLARHQASSGRQYVTNLRHEAVHLNDFERQMLPLLDGTRSHEALAADLAALVAAGSLSVQQDGKPVTDPATVRSVVAMAVGRQIEQFTLQSLLVG